MFGISFTEFFIIAVVAVIALGPEKLPKAMVEIAKFFKFFTKAMNDAKQSFEQEIKIAELKDEAAKYKESLTKTGENIRKKLTFEELDEIKKNISSSAQKLNESFNDIKSEISENKISKRDEDLSENLQNDEIKVQNSRPKETKESKDV